MTGADLLVKILKAEGIRQCFCFPMSPIIEAMARAGLRVITTRQEERVAGNMADGVSRSTNGNEIGVFTVQALAGSENAFAGVAQAHTDSTPLLFLPGHPGTSYVDQPPTFDSTANYAATTKMAQKVLAADQLPIKLRQAFTALRSGRPQTVMLELPGDVCAAEIDDDLPYTPVRRMRSAADEGAVREAAERLLAAETPLIWAGQGVLYAEASAELAEVAALLGAPVATTLQGKSAIPESASAGGGRGRAVDHRHDRPLSAGERCRARSRHEPDARALHAGDPGGEDDPPRDRGPHRHQQGISGGPRHGRRRQALPGAARRRAPAQGGRGPRLSGRPGPPRPSPASSATGAPSTSRSSPTIRAPINGYRMMRELWALLDPETSMLTHESGASRDIQSVFYEAGPPRSYLGWGQSSQLGFSLGLAMGAKLANPDKLVVNVMGDAAVGMTGMDWETASRNEIPILTVVKHDSIFSGYDRNIPEASARYRANTQQGDYGSIARSLGCHAETVTETAALRPALERGIRAVGEGQPAVVDVITAETRKLSRLAPTSIG